MFQAKKGWQTQKWGEMSSWHTHFHTSLTSVVHRTTSESKISVGQSSQWQLVWIAQSSRRILHGQKQRKPGKSSPNMPKFYHARSNGTLSPVLCWWEKRWCFQLTSIDILCVESKPGTLKDLLHGQGGGRFCCTQQFVHHLLQCLQVTEHSQNSHLHHLE